jgi:hypothetical protein
MSVFPASILSRSLTSVFVAKYPLSTNKKVTPNPESNIGGSM